MMTKLTMICVALVLLGGVIGCGGSQHESAYRREAARFFASECRHTSLNTQHCGEEARKLCEQPIGSGPHEEEGRNAICKLASLISERVKHAEEGGDNTEALAKERTSQEEEHRRNNMEAEEKAAHEEGALANTPGARNACEEEKRAQEKLQYEHPGSPPEPQREAEYEKLCGR
jgi:hypothetical protein